MEVRIKTQNLDRTFAALPRTTRSKALRPALREGAKVVQKAAIANVKAVTGEDSTGTLARNIVVRSYKQYKGMLRAGVQIRQGAVYAGKKDSKGPVRVALVGAVLEYGKQGQPPRSWIRKAAREKAQEAIDAVTREAGKRMAAAVREANS